MLARALLVIEGCDPAADRPKWLARHRKRERGTLRSSEGIVRTGLVCVEQLSEPQELIVGHGVFDELHASEIQCQGEVVDPSSLSHVIEVGDERHSAVTEQDVVAPEIAVNQLSW